MKTTVLLTIAVLIANCLQGQIESERKLNSNGDLHIQSHEHFFAKFQNNDLNPFIFRGQSNIAHNNENYRNPLDSKQKLDSIIDYIRYDTNSTWIKWQKEEFAYDANANHVFEARFDWDTTAKVWIPDVKTEYNYNSSNKLIMDVYSNWNTIISSWVPNYKYEYTYDANENLSQSIYNDYVEMTSEWEPISKHDYSYNSNGYNTLMIYYLWSEENNNWNKSSKSEHSYDDDGNVILSVSFSWSFSSESWGYTYKHEYAYDDNNMTQEITYHWDPDIAEWIITSKLENVYNANNKLIAEITSNWNQETSEYIPSYKGEYSYDENDNIIQSDWNYWDMGSSQWLPEMKNNYAYNNEYTWSDLILPYNELIFERYFNHMLLGYLGSAWYEPLNVWMEWVKGDFYYSEETTGISEKSIGEVKVYPNPAADIVTFELDQPGQPTLLKVFDFQGRKVLEQNLNDKKHISVHSLGSGMYLYSIDQDEKSFRGKFIVK